MIPLRDSNPSATVPIVTIVLIVINSIVWLYEVSLGARADQFIVEYGLIPVRFLNFYRYSGGLTDNAIVPLFSSIFMHAGWLHVIGNMWFLWIFGDNVEDRLGHITYLIFYILCGLGSSLIHVFFNTGSQIPTIGASGAISGVLGAYLVSFPHARIHTLLIIFIIIRFVELPAFIFLIIWFAFQFISGTAQIGARGDVGGVAYWAHMGGFVVGILLLWIMPKKPVYRTTRW
ncbi:MAG: rhomboid family intramembrane serine protease [Desulfomonile tiedjei]|nr:rhomboid family intramembrane serine protease [Desulfomonile tiedjei]